MHVDTCILQVFSSAEIRKQEINRKNAEEGGCIFFRDAACEAAFTESDVDLSMFCPALNLHTQNQPPLDVRHIQMFLCQQSLAMFTASTPKCDLGNVKMRGLEMTARNFLTVSQNWRATFTIAARNAAHELQK